MVIGIDSSRAFIREKTGTENYSYHLIKAILRLPESRAHTFVLFTRPNPILPVELSGYSNIIIKIVNWPYLWTQVGLAWETWLEPKLDVLWIPAHTLPVLRKPSIRTVVTIHGLEYQWLPEYKNWLQKWYLPLSTIYAASSASQLIAVSEFTAKQLQKELHTSNKKIKVIHEGVEFIPVTKKINSEKLMQKYQLSSSKFILFVGTIQPRKNLVALVEAFSQFSKHFPEYKLVIAGGMGWMVEDVVAAPRRYKVEDKVVFTNRVSDLELNTLYQEALMYVQPSITEGFGLPILEAMNFGLPVIASDGGALPEVIGDAGIVIKLDINFVAELASTMKKVASDPQLRSKMIANGKKRVSNFSWVKAAKETLNTLIN